MVKKLSQKVFAIISTNIHQFSKFFYSVTKYAIKWSLKIPTHLSQWNNFDNESILDEVMKSGGWLNKGLANIAFTLHTFSILQCVNTGCYR